MWLLRVIIICCSCLCLLHFGTCRAIYIIWTCRWTCLYFTMFLCIGDVISIVFEETISKEKVVMYLYITFRYRLVIVWNISRKDYWRRSIASLIGHWWPIKTHTEETHVSHIDECKIVDLYVFCCWDSDCLWRSLRRLKVRSRRSRSSWWWLSLSTASSQGWQLTVKTNLDWKEQALGNRSDNSLSFIIIIHSLWIPHLILNAFNQ